MRRQRSNHRSGELQRSVAGSGWRGDATAGGATQAPGGLPTQAPAAPNTAEGACALLTPDEIEEATGFRPIRTTPTTAPGDLPVGCEWELDNVTRGTGDFPWAIVIGVRSPGGRAVYDAFVASPVQAGEPVAGVGDDAQQNEDAVVDAVKGDTMITVTWMEFPPRAEVTVELARLALEGV